MKRFLMILFFTICIINLGNSQVARNLNLKFMTPLDFERWTIIDDFNFDKIQNWNLTEKAESTTQQVGVPLFFKKITPGVKFLSVRGDERFYTDAYKENPACLGVKILFPEMNKTIVTLLPKESYKIDGRCKKLGLWLLGRGRDFDFGIIIRDYLGRNYHLDITKLDFMGWQFFEIKIPPYIPQSFDIYPQRMTIEIVGFYVINHPVKYADVLHRPFYLYIDNLEGLIDKFESQYPGVEILDNW